MKAIYFFLKLTSILFIINLTERTNCNIWDNLISQQSSPQFEIPDEIKLELYNLDHKAMEVYISSNFNLMKFSLINEDLVKTVIPNNITSTVADIYLNFTNGTIKIDFDDVCYFRNISAINKLNTKFILFSYDLFTYFHDTLDYYEYIFTNPLSQGVDTRMKSDFTLKNFESVEGESSAININERRNKQKDVLNEVLNRYNIFEKDSMILFKVNKTTSSLESLSLKLKNVDLNNLDVKVYNVDQFDKNIFNISHECIFLEDKNVDEVDSKIVNQSENFLSYIE